MDRRPVRQLVDNHPLCEPRRMPLAPAKMQKQNGNTDKAGPPYSWPERIRRWFRKLFGKIVMDAPPDWDVHPDVAKKLRDRDER